MNNKTDTWTCYFTKNNGCQRLMLNNVKSSDLVVTIDDLYDDDWQIEDIKNSATNERHPDINRIIETVENGPSDWNGIIAFWCVILILLCVLGVLTHHFMGIFFK